MNDIQITLYNPTYQEAFATLNRVWIERHFTLEPHDLEQLNQPERYVLAGGGQVFFALDGEIVVGTCAMVAIDDGDFELAKMCVADGFQGRGIGRALGLAAINWAREQGAARIWLESNRRLTPALQLYRSLGFQEVPLVPSPYARADIRMEMDLADMSA